MIPEDSSKWEAWLQKPEVMALQTTLVDPTYEDDTRISFGLQSFLPKANATPLKAFVTSQSIEYSVNGETMAIGYSGITIGHSRK